MLAQTAEVRRRLAKPADGELTINLTYIDRASFVDLLPIAAQSAARLFGGWLVRAVGIAVTAAITLLVARAFGKL